MGLYIKVNRKRYDQYMQKLQAKIANGPMRLFKLLAIWMHRAVDTIFKRGGYGRGKFLPISATIYGRRRPGTDGSTSRRYGPSSQPLMASRGYFMSFRAQRITNKDLVFGSKYKLAREIQYAGHNRKDMPFKPRFVLPVMDATETQGALKPILVEFVRHLTRPDK